MSCVITSIAYLRSIVISSLKSLELSSFIDLCSMFGANSVAKLLASILLPWIRWPKKNTTFNNKNNAIIITPFLFIFLFEQMKDYLVNSIYHVRLLCLQRISPKHLET